MIPDSWVELRDLNIKSLRVLAGWRAFPADCPHVPLDFYCPALAGEYQQAVEEFPAYGSVLLRLAIGLP